MDAGDLDGERLYGMDGRDRKALKLALASAVLTWNRLNELVDGLGRTLSDYAAHDMPLPSVAFAVIGGARAEGWLAELVAEAVTTYPGNWALASFARRFVRGDDAADPVPEFPPNQWSRRDVGQRWGGQPGPALAAIPDRRVIPRRLRATSTVYFDLTDVEAELVATRDASGPLAAFATTYADESYLNVLRERFGYVFPDTAVPDVLSLSDHLMSPERAATEPRSTGDFL